MVTMDDGHAGAVPPGGPLGVQDRLPVDVQRSVPTGPAANRDAEIPPGRSAVQVSTPIRRLHSGTAGQCQVRSNEVRLPEHEPLRTNMSFFANAMLVLSGPSAFSRVPCG